MINIANEIYKTMGIGHTESVYHRCMEAELRKKGIPYASEVVTPLAYKGTYVGYGRADIVIPKDIVIELKAISSPIRDLEVARLRTYMKSLNIKQGIIINFSQSTKYVKKKCDIKII